jgi:hypothetical protein
MSESSDEDFVCLPNSGKHVVRQSALPVAGYSGKKGNRKQAHRPNQQRIQEKP